MKKKIIILIVIAIFLALFNNLYYIFEKGYPGIPLESHFISSIFDVVKVTKTRSFTLGMQNLFVLIVFLFVMHDYISKDILQQGVYALVRLQKHGKWLFGKVCELAVMCGVYLGAYLIVVYELSSYHTSRTWTLPCSALVIKAWIALFMILFVSLLFTVILDVTAGRNISCIIGVIVLGALIMIGMYQPYKQFQHAIWKLAVNPACAMFVYTSAGRTGFTQMLLIYDAEIGVLFLIFARYLEHIDLIKLEKSEGC